MKKTILWVAVCATLIAVGCDKIQKLTEFDIPYNTSFTIPATQLLGIGLPIDVPTPDITTNAESTFSSNGTAKDLIDNVKLSQLRMTINDSTHTQTFNFLRNATIYIKADGLAEAQIAKLDSIPLGVTVVDFTTPSTNLTDYITKNSFSLRIAATSRQASATAIKIDVTSNFHVNAKILNQ
jgi:hypothetical protein